MGMIGIRKFVVGVMGGGDNISPENLALAYQLGALIAKEGWVLLNGGRPAGVMEASAKGAKDNGGLTVGISPDSSSQGASSYIDIVIVTGMGDGRNHLNVLSSDIIVALPGKAGTISEIALALKSRKKVILLNFNTGKLFDSYRVNGLLKSAETAEEVILIIKGESS
jgi:uncharacterized protein (TIGR00725 family)